MPDELASPFGWRSLADRSSSTAELTAPHETTNRSAVAFDLDGFDSPAGRVGHEPLRNGTRQHRHVLMTLRRLNAADLGVALAIDSTRKRVARAAQKAAVRRPWIDQPEGQRRRMQPLLANRVK